MKASFFPPLPSPLLSFPGKSLDHFGRTTTTLMASLSPWRRHFGSSACGGRLLVVVAGSLWSLCFCACLGLHRQLRLGCIGRVLADALPPCSGGCLATAVVLVLVSGGCFAALMDRVDALPLLSCCRSLHPWRCNILLQVLVAFVSRIAGLPMSFLFFLVVFVFSLIASAY